MTAVLAETEVAWVTVLTQRGSLPVHEATWAHSSSQRRPPSPGAVRSPPDTRWTTFTRLGLAGALGDRGWNMVRIETEIVCFSRDPRL